MALDRRTLIGTGLALSAAGAGPVFSSLTRSSLMTTAPPLGKASKDRPSSARSFASSQSCMIIDRRCTS